MPSMCWQWGLVPYSGAVASEIMREAVGRPSACMLLDVIFSVGHTLDDTAVLCERRHHEPAC